MMGVASMSAEIFQKLPPSESRRRIEFEKAEVHPGIVSNTYILVVTGTASCMNMRVRLEPLVYVRQPEFWGIEVIGCLTGGICLPAARPFTESISLAGITGTKGIEVIGATHAQKIDVPPKYGDHAKPASPG
jgi:hypothetical protein